MSPTAIRISLLAVGGALITGAAISAKHFLAGQEKKEAPAAPQYPVLVDLHPEREALKKLPKVAPSGTFGIEITRMPFSRGAPYSVSDEGSAIVSVKPDKGQFELWKDGKYSALPARPLNLKPMLATDGVVRDWLNLTVDEFSTEPDKLQPVFRGAEYFQPFWEPNGDLIFSRAVIKPSDHRTYYVLDRESHDIQQIPKESIARERITSKDRYFETKYFMMLVEVGDTGIAWLRERHGSATADFERLLTVDTSKPAPQTPEEVALPPGYHEIRRVSQTKGKVVATFGPVGTPMPCRTFVQRGKDWKELPIPAGYECSYVDRVLANGLVVGYIMGDDPVKLKNVVWKDDQICILNDLPQWPKGGQVSIIDVVGRDGTLVVQNVTDLGSRARDYYMFKIGNPK